MDINQIKTPDEFVAVMDALDRYVGEMLLRDVHDRPRRFPLVQEVLKRMESEFCRMVGEVPPGGGELSDEELANLPVLDMEKTCSGE